MKKGATTVKKEEKAKASASPASSEDGKGSEKGFPKRRRSLRSWSNEPRERNVGIA